MSSSICIYPDYSALAAATAEHIVTVMNEAVSARGKCVLALSGGETPKKVYADLGSEPLRSRLDWRNIHVWLVDERMVPTDDPQSNFGMIQQELLSKSNIPPEQIHHFRTELGAEEAALAYEKELQIEMGDTIPKFDLILLGIGTEGHTASLFPDTAALVETERLVSANFIPKLNSWRVTLTLATLNNAREVCFLASGNNKAQIVQKVVERKTIDPEIPATLVDPVHGITQWMLDAGAATYLDRSKHPDLNKL